MSYYQRLRDLREDEDKTQTEIAKVIKTTQKQYSRWETGDYDIPFEIVIELAKYYKVSLDYIAGLTNNKGGIGYGKDITAKTIIDQSGANRPIGIINNKEKK